MQHSARLQRGQRSAGITGGEAHQSVLGLGRQRERTAEAALICHRSAQQFANLATDLLRWFALRFLDHSLADTEPKTLRYRLLHTAARIVRGNDDARSK